MVVSLLGPALVSVCRVVAFVGVATPLEDPCVWLGDVGRVGCVAEVCAARTETGVERAAYGTVGSVEEPTVGLLDEVLKVEDEVGSRGRVVLAVVAVVVVKTVTLKVSSSVMWDLSVTVTGLVDRKASVTSTGLSVTASSVSDVLLLTVEGPAVGTKPTSSSLVLENSPSVPSWVLELWGSVEDSVEASTPETDPWSVRELLTAPSTDEVKGGVEEEMETSAWSVLGSVSLRGGVESADSSDADVC